VHFALFLPNFGPFGDPGEVVRLARDAEDAGWDGVFLWDHIAFERRNEQPVLDPWIALAAIAACTSHISLGTMVTPLARRRPWKVARETVTLDQLSGGRLVLGVGLGFPPDAEFSAFGEEADARIRAAKLDEGLAILAGLWTGRSFSLNGDHFRVRDVTFRPTPARGPRIPVWCAGWWPNRAPFRRAARWDGVVPEKVGGATPSPKEVSEIARYVGRFREAPEPFDIAINGYSDGADSGELMRAYEAAGATWWLERIDPTRLFTLDEARSRVRAGPPGPNLRGGVMPTEEGAAP
jgi:alkanesulfonate monooxygenase SsuD/methylene tetrahydromethanopterin reductase-like flavin-dependent oxidoreductase (luciferase family)